MGSFTTADCSGDAAAIVGTRASSNTSKTPFAFDGVGDTWWQGRCKSCAPLKEWLAFRTESDIKCWKVLQCVPSGWARTLQLQYLAPNTPDWVSSLHVPVVAAPPGNWTTIRLPGHSAPPQTCDAAGQAGSAGCVDAAAA